MCYFLLEWSAREKEAVQNVKVGQALARASMPSKKPGFLCTGFKHKYPLEETRFESVEDTEGQAFRRRVCVLASRLNRVKDENQQLRFQVLSCMSSCGMQESSGTHSKRGCCKWKAR